MKSAGKILLGIILAGILALVAYGVYKYLLPRWVPILFYSYSAVGVIFVLAGLIVWIRLAKASTIRESMIRTARIVNQHRGSMGWVTAFRDQAAIVCMTISNASTWPVPYVMSFSLQMQQKRAQTAMNTREVGAHFSTKVVPLYVGMFSLAVVLTIYFLADHSARLGQYGVFALGILLAGTTLRHMGYSIGTVSLPAHLRRASAQPYLAFLAVIAMDFSVLVLTLTVFVKHQGISGVSFADLRHCAESILEAREPINLIKGAKLSIDQILTGLVGLLFYLAVLKALLEFKEFKRRDEDYISMGDAANELGKFSTALRHLENIRDWNRTARETKIVALLGVNQIASAEKEVRQLLEDEKKDLSPEYVFITLIGLCVLGKAPSEARLEIFRRAIGAKVGDVSILQGVQLEGELGPILPEMNKMLSPVAADYPLTSAFIAFTSKDFQVALQILEGASSTEPLKEIGRLVLLLLVTLSDPKTTREEDIKAFQSWERTNLARFKELVGGLDAPLDIFIAHSQITMLAMFAKRMDKERVEELKYLADSLRSKVTSEAGWMKVADLQMEAALKD